MFHVHASSHAFHAAKVLAEASFVVAVGLFSLILVGTQVGTWLFG